MSSYVYVLRCGDGSLYTGWTNDLEQRLAAHQSGKGAKYTRGRLPIEMVYFEEMPDKSAALKRENELKKLKKAEKELLIKTSR
ncbi:MAG: GIY-YIG nuclease family protein [Acidaminococcaceae bacterium]|nr:GIY-YIG nuclease family protein [Acidaminococcaceae bacterium]